jgi:thiosulfate/3-mercaptopyruvate sulfurtransferase
VDFMHTLYVDCRPHDAYLAGHVPGAVHADPERDLTGDVGGGRHPLPSAARFAAWASAAGIGPGVHVAAYDDGTGWGARLWWLLRHFGHGGGRVLDGGIQAWAASGRPLVTDVPPARAAPPLALVPDPRMVVDKRRVAELAGSPTALVLDARAPERFEGKVEPIDARAGHVPGARNAPFVENLLAPEGTFRDRFDLARRYAALGAGKAQTIVAYCGSGITACHDLLALDLVGRPDALLYEGSWSDWARDPALPAAQGKA